MTAYSKFFLICVCSLLFCGGVVVTAVNVTNWYRGGQPEAQPTELRMTIPAGWECFETGNTVVCHPRKEIP